MDPVLLDRERQPERSPRAADGALDRSTTPSLCSGSGPSGRRGFAFRTAPDHPSATPKPIPERLGTQSAEALRTGLAAAGVGPAAGGRYAAASHRASPGSLGTVPSISRVIRTRSNLDRSKGTSTTVTPVLGTNVFANTVFTPSESQIP